MGFTVCHTVVRAGSELRLHYRRHFEACYCIAGAGEVEDMSGVVHRIEPGTIYVLDEHDEHYLRADPASDMILVSVFNPPSGRDRAACLERGQAAQPTDRRPAADRSRAQGRPGRSVSTLVFRVRICDLPGASPWQAGKSRERNVAKTMPSQQRNDSSHHLILTVISSK